MEKERLLAQFTKPDRKSPIPLYYQIQNEVERMISSGLLLFGTRLPGDLEMSNLLKVNYRTVRQAYDGLVEKGLLKRIRKAGTFVNMRVQQKTPSVGFFYFRELETSFALKWAEQIHHFLVGYSFDLKIIPFGKDYYDQNDIYQEILKKDLQGAIITTLDNEECKRQMCNLEKKEFPYVRFPNESFPGQLRSTVIKGDELQNITETMKYLWDLGHRQIGLVYSSQEKDYAIPNGYRDFYAHKKQVFNPQWCMDLVFSGTWEQWRKFPGLHIARGYLENNPDITAVTVRNPLLCIDLLRQALMVGKRVPEDLSIMSLWNWGGLNAVAVPISAMHLSPELMAQAAVEQLMKTIREGLPEKEKIVKVAYTLKERASVAAPKKVAEELVTA